jgi:Kef-type K+ transport system membrane component KefB
LENFFLLEIAVILIFTKTLALFTRKLHIPQVVGALIAGVVLGPAILGFITPNEMIEKMAEIGVILLMFNAGLETNFSQLKITLKSAFVIAALGVIVPLGGGFVLAYVFGEGILESVFIGVLLTATSVSITVETLQEMGKLKTMTGTAVLGAAVVDDIVGIIILSAIMQIGDGGLTFAGTALVFARIVGFFVLALIVGYAAFKLFEYIDSKFGEIRRVSIMALALCFALAYFSEIFGVANIIGAYVAGIILCNSKSAQYIESKTNVLSYMLFSPIFFVSVGLTISFDGFSPRILLFAGLLLLMAIITKVAGCGLGAKLCRFSNRESLQIASGMVSRGEVALIVAVKGASVNLVNPSLFPSVILVVIITTLITPIMLKFAYNSKNNGQEVEKMI